MLKRGRPPARRVAELAAEIPRIRLRHCQISNSTTRPRRSCAAFQRHFRPARVDGVADCSTVLTLDRLIARTPVAGLTAGRGNAYIQRRQPAGRPLPQSRKAAGEESPGSMETRCRVTPGGGDPRESATESKPPARRSAPSAVRVKGWGKSPPRTRQRGRHGKPHREQDRIGTARGFELRPVSGPAVRVGCARRPATGVPEEWPPRRRATPAIQNPAYRPAGTFTPRARRGRLRWRGSRRRSYCQQNFTSAPFSFRFALKSARFLGSSK